MIIVTVGIALSAGVGCFSSWIDSLSVVIGVVTAVVYLDLIGRQIRKSLRGDPDGAKRVSVQGVFLRYLVLLVVLVAATRLDWVAIHWVMGGLLLIPISSFISVFAVPPHAKKR